MAINKFMRAALKAMSYADIDYKIERGVKKLAGKNPINGLHTDIERTIERDGRKVPVALYYPINATSDEVILFFHGGGWVSGNVDSYARTCGMLGDKTGRRVTFEYVLLNEVNDSYENAMELSKLLKGMNCYVNLIPYNETSHIEYKKSSQERILAFYDTLKKNKINVTIRREFGADLMAACGQLRSNYEEGH